MMLICWLRGFIRTVCTGGVLTGITVSGHAYVERAMPGQPCVVQVLKCSICGQSSFSWSRCYRSGCGSLRR